MHHRRRDDKLGDRLPVQKSAGVRSAAKNTGAATVYPEDDYQLPKHTAHARGAGGDADGWMGEPAAQKEYLLPRGKSRAGAVYGAEAVLQKRPQRGPAAPVNQKRNPQPDPHPHLYPVPVGVRT